MAEYRIEHDSIGEKEVPVDAYYGVQSLRGNENFPISGQHLHPAMIRALAMVKKACAIANARAGILDEKVKGAIIQAADEILEGKFHDAFLTDPIQGGAGTTANMNANEVIANRANEILGGALGKYDHVHPNDHVNMGQSTNDVYPTAGKLGALMLFEKLEESLTELRDDFLEKAKEFDHIIKMGRTQLQDAVPIRLGQEFEAYASALARDQRRIAYAKKAIEVINMGASAIGTGINVDLHYFENITDDLAKLTGIPFTQAGDLVDGTQHIDSLVEVSGALRTLGVDLSKISNDLRLMSSGPRTMIGDIHLPARQNGSSIMPGKVNPVIPEVVSQVAFRVMGNDLTISLCAEGGQMELNAFEPVAFYALYESITMLTHAMETLRTNCVEGITANEEKLKGDVERSVGVVTALVPHIGYEHSASIAKKALRTGKSVRSLILEEKLLTEEELNEILDPWAMTKPGIAAKHLLEQK